PLSKNRMINDLSKKVFIASLETRSIVQCNQETEAYSGYSLKEIKAMGSDFFKAWIHPLDYPHSLNIQDIILAGWDKWENEARICLTKKKEWYWSETEIRIKERDKKGNPKKIIAHINIGEKVDLETSPIKGSHHQYFTQRLTCCEEKMLPYLAAG